jgi:CHAT domain-containing protein
MCLRHAVWRSPVSISDTARGYRALNKPVRCLIIGDAGSGQPPELNPLDGAEREAADIVKLLRRRLQPKDVTHLSRKNATRNRILRELQKGDYDIVHFGGHAWFTERESYFFTWDHIMLGSELATLLSRRPPSLLVMSTHFTSFIPLGFNEDFIAKLGGRINLLEEAGLETPSSFAEVAMKCGVATFVGSFGEPPDEDSADTMIAFYKAFLQGNSVAKSLTEARKQRFQKGHTSSSMFTITGHGELQL